MSLSMFAKAALATSSLMLSYHATCNQINKKSDIQFGTVCTKQYNANNPIQDRLRTFQLKKINGLVAAVFDGHGGDLCAQYAVGNIQKVLNNRIEKNIRMGNIQNTLTQSLEECYDELQEGFKTIFKQNLQNQNYRGVGACALTAIVTQQFMVVGNSGDCEGVILGGEKAIKINQRHNAGEPAEQQRLKRQFPDQSDIYKCLPNTNYCYVKGRLQPTRSLGDFYLKNQQYNFTKLQKFTGPYITHKPQISVFPNIKSLGKTLVIATDGLWDQLDQKQMTTILEPYHGTDQPAQVLFQAALKKILQKNKISSFQKLNQIAYRRDLHDDISIITVNLEKIKKPSTFTEKVQEWFGKRKV